MFDGTLGKRDTNNIDLEVKQGSKLFNDRYYLVPNFNNRYYLVPNINNDNFCNDIQCLVEIGVLTHVQKSQYGTPVFKIPKKEGNMSFIMDYRKINQRIVRDTYPFSILGGKI